MQVPLPWERSLWSAHAWWTLGRRYVLTDFRLVVVDGQHSDEIALGDIREVLRTETWLDRLAGTSTLTVLSRTSRQNPVVLTGVRRGAQLAAFLELLSTTHAESLDDDAVKAALSEQHNIEIRGFGTFKIRQRKTRMARNPRTGDPVEVAARPVPVFKPSKELRAMVADQNARVGP